MRMKDHLSINEFSKFSGIEASTLRYWDDIGLFSPSKRDPNNNYRYYSPDQIIAVNFITVLSELKIPLKTISDIEIDRTPEVIMDLIENQENLLDMEMRQLRERYSIIHARRDLIKLGLKAQAPEVSVRFLEEKPFILGPRNEFVGESFYEPFVHFCQQAKELRINLSYPIGAYHETTEAFFKAPGQPDYFFSIDPTGNNRREAGEYLVGITRGYYGELDDIAEKMKAYADKNSLSFSGPAYVIYLHDEVCLRDPSQYLAQACVAVSRNNPL